MRQELEQKQGNSPVIAEASAPGQQPPQPAPDPAAHLAALQDSFDLLSEKVQDQNQTKVSSGSKYPVRLSGLVLMNVFSNRGNTDNQDIPTWAVPPSSFSSAGNFGATLRQSEIGLEVFGPKLAGAKTTGSVQLDFAGGFPNVSNGVNFGVVRLRTATVRFDWANTSIVGGQDGIFISPLSSTSFASLAIPAFSYSGNLWGWIPQVRVEHRFSLSDTSSFLLQGGVFDNVTGEPPYFGDYRQPQAGERSSQPAFGSRVAFTRTIFGEPLTLGAAGFYSRQDWGFNRHVDGWAGMTDVQLPLAPKLILSGEFYDGKAVGGLGGGIGNSVVFDGNPLSASADVYGVNSLGGWAQLKLKATSKLEFNGSFGMDNPQASDLRDNSPFQDYGSTLVRNRGTLVNFVYRPRSNLLLSSEYRHLRTFQLDNSSETADQINMIVGILF
ncbi:MAG: hypothetical protein H0X25_11730 [Acidobacteriales bacterium]|nr:hypothetical protein [Terriglobales bacterium]